MSYRGCEMTAFEKGVDFILHFSGKKFTTKDIMKRYAVCYRQAVRIRNQADRVIGLKPAGFGKRTAACGPEPFLWEIKCLSFENVQNQNV